MIDGLENKSIGVYKMETNIKKLRILLDSQTDLTKALDRLVSVPSATRLLTVLEVLQDVGIIIIK
jgi:hypothetical protein